MDRKIVLKPYELCFLNDYFKEFDKEITKYQWPEPFATIEEARGLLQEFMDEAEREEMLFFAILSQDGRFVGSSEIHGLEEDCPEIGIWIIKSEQGKGYAYEALKDTLDYARKNYDKSAFFYEADVRNVGSMKLLKKFEGEYNITSRKPEKLITDSGKELELQGFVMEVK